MLATLSMARSSVKTTQQVRNIIHEEMYSETALGGGSRHKPVCTPSHYSTAHKANGSQSLTSLNVFLDFSQMLVASQEF